MIKHRQLALAPVWPAHAQAQALRRECEARRDNALSTKAHAVKVGKL